MKRKFAQKMLTDVEHDRHNDKYVGILVTEAKIVWWL